MANFPNSLDSFIVHSDNVRETIAAIHANSIQDAVLAIESTLGTKPQGTAATVKDRLAALELSVSQAVTNQGYAPPVASTTTRGIVKLGGDLSGTADAPRLTVLPNLATIAYADAPFKAINLGAVSGAVTLDLTQGTFFTLTAIGNVTFTVIGWNTKAVSQHVMVRVIQDATGGRTVTWPTRFSTNSTTTGIATTGNSYALYEFASPDIGASVSLWAQPAFLVPVQADRFDSAVLSLNNLLYYWPTEETSGTTAADASGASAPGTYSGTFTFAATNIVPTSTKLGPTFTAANSNYIQRDAVRRAASTSAWTLGFTFSSLDPGIGSQRTFYSETLSTDNTTGQGFYLESGTTALSGGMTAMNMRLTNNSGVDVFKKVLSSKFFDSNAHFVVITFDGGNTYSVYFDGALVDTVVQTPTAATVDRATWGARRRLSNDRFYSGGLGRMFLRSTVTSAAEIAALSTAFNNGAAQGSGQGGGGQNQGGGQGGSGTYDKNGVQLGVPSVTVNNSQIGVSATINRSQTVNFTFLQIAVRPPATGGTAFSTAYTPGTQTGSGSQVITGTGTCDQPGTWTAFATYSLAASPVQADWIDGVPVSFTIGTPAPPDPTTTPTGGGVSTTKMLLGTSGTGSANGGDDAWIGKAIDVAGTWCDVDGGTQVNLSSIPPGSEYGSWNRYLDIAVGGIFPKQGESWTSAAGGAYDARFRQCLTNLARYWGTRDPSKIFLRFAHEFNGDWFWPVRGSEVNAFITTWRKFRALQKEIIPLANLVWCPNYNSTGSLGLNTLDAWPGNSYVDVYGVDTYNSYPFQTFPTAQSFTDYLNLGVGTRAPYGLESHRQAALSFGKPIGIGEWGSSGDGGSQGGGGDAPNYYNKMFDYMFANQGSGPGQFLYAVMYNLDQFKVNPNFNQPNAANAFKTRMLSRT